MEQQVQHIDYITKFVLFYKCKYCSQTHSHGNEKMSIIGNWKTYRKSHCLRKKAELLLIIDNFTIRNVF